MSQLSTDFRVCASLEPTSALAAPSTRTAEPPHHHRRNAGRWGRLTGFHGIAIAAILALAILGAAFAEGYHSNPWLLSWIPAACCVTNDCCWEVQESELRPLPDDRWEVVSTGQVRRRTDWSPDGKFYRCACDYTGSKWIKHQGANTRCLFVPMRSASR